MYLIVAFEVKVLQRNSFPGEHKHLQEGKH